MHNRKIAAQIQRLRDLIRKTNDACGENIELQSHWAKYVCIVSAGLLENSVKEVYIEYASNQVSAPVANFVASKLSQIRNPKAERFLEISSTFSSTWRSELDDFMQEEGRREAIDSIIMNRHLIAHGNEQQSGVTVSQMNEWLKKAIEVLEFIEGQCRQ